MKKRFAIGMMSILPLMSILTIFPVHAVPEIYMTPSTNPPDPGPYIGFKWNITIWVKGYGIPPIFAWEVRLNYDPAAGINITRAWRARFDPAYIFSGRVTVTCSPPIIEEGTVLAADSLLIGPHGETPPPDPASLAIIEFEIIDAPGKFETLYTDLDINNADTYLLDDNLNLVTVTKTNGSYTWMWPAFDMPYVTVDPSYLEFDNLTSWNGTEFDIQVQIKECSIGWDMQNASFKLNYNDTLTNIVSTTVDPAWTGPNTIDTSVSGVISAFVSGDGPLPIGDVPVLNVTFLIQGQGTSPPRPLGAYDVSNLVFSDLELWDEFGLIPTDPPINGLVKIFTRGPPWFEVIPNQHISEKPETFDVEIWLNNVRLDQRMVGHSMRLLFNGTLLEVLNVTQGPFLNDSRWNNYGTIFIFEVEEVFIYGWQVLISELILPNPETDEWDSFPEGSGPIATITFQGIYQDLRENYCTLEIEARLTDDKAESIPIAPSVDGFYYIFRNFHDVAITDVTPSVTEAHVGWTVDVNVTVANYGSYVETFNVTVNYDSTTIETKPVSDLSPTENVTLTFNWDTTGLTLGNYTITAEAGIVLMEENIGNNIFVDGVVRIKMQGDVNGDNKIDIKDIAIAALAFGSFPGHPRWNPQADVNQDGKVDIRDLALIASNFGKK